MIPLPTVIVDDEPDSVKLLQIELEKHCPQVDIIGIYTDPKKAVQDIEKLAPQLLFLDIEMPILNGFELLERILHINFSVVFVTAYNQFALKAFKFNALDYLVKPFDTPELIAAVAKAQKQSKPSATELSLIKRQLQGEPISKIAIPGNNGIFFIDFNEIIYVEASNNYSKVLLSDGRQFTISKTLKDVQEVLEERHFLRVHRQYIINLNCLKQFNRNESILTMDNGDAIPIARNQKERLSEKFGWL
jgi:two-component system LytT family response regulator